MRALEIPRAVRSERVTWQLLGPLLLVEAALVIMQGLLSPYIPLAVLGVLLMGILALAPFEYAVSFLFLAFVVLNKPIGGPFRVSYFLLQDMLLVFAAGVWLLKLAAQRRRESLRKSPLSLALGVFIGVGILAAWVGLRAGNHLSYLFFDVRELAYYGIVYLLMLDSLERREQVRLILGTLILSVNVFALESLLYPFAVKTALTASASSMGLRYVVPTSVYLPVMLTLICGLLVFEQDRRRRLGLFLTMVLPAVALVFTFTRGYWLGMIAGFAFVLLVSPGARKIRLLAYLLAAGFLLWFAVPVLLGLSGRFLWQGVVGRGGLGKAGPDYSVLSRLLEMASIIKEFPEHPILGRGLGATLRVFKTSGVGFIEWWDIHNNYFEILHKMGLVGFVAFAFLVLAVLATGFRAYRNLRDSYFRGICLGLLGSYFSLLVISLTSGFVLRIDTAVYTATLMAMLETFRRWSTLPLAEEVAGG